MSKLTIISPGITAALLLGAVPLAMASSGPNMRGQNGAATQSQTSSQESGRVSATHATEWTAPKAPTAADVQPFAEAKVSLAQAISNAQQQESGKAIEAQFEMLRGTPVYFVRWVSNSNDNGNGNNSANGSGNGFAGASGNGSAGSYGNSGSSGNGNGNRVSVWEGWVDAQTGQLIGKPRMVPQNQLNTSLRRRAAIAQNANTSLSDAIGTAQQKRGGKAIMGTLKAGPAGAAYDLSLVRGGQIHTAMVNVQSGNLK